jgi:DNA-binding response OmpR family regulator
MFMSNVDKVITREQVLDKIWDISGNYVNDNTLTVYIKRIRNKLGEDIIKTVKGIGYRMDQK